MNKHRAASKKRDQNPVAAAPAHAPASIPSKQSRDLLKLIKRKGNVNREDLEQILKLDQKNQEFVVSHISERRKQLLLKHLDNLPNIENESFNFELSRKESY